MSASIILSLFALSFIIFESSPEDMFIDFFVLERKEGGGGERETNISWDRTHNPGMCPDQGLNPQPFGIRDNVPTNAATQPGLSFTFQLHLPALSFAVMVQNGTD